MGTSKGMRVHHGTVADGRRRARCGRARGAVLALVVLAGGSVVVTTGVGGAAAAPGAACEVRPGLVDLGSLGGANTSPYAVDGEVVVGVGQIDDRTAHPFAIDLGAPHPLMRALGGPNDSVALATDGTTVVGQLAIGEQDAQTGRAFAYDLGTGVETQLDGG